MKKLFILSIFISVTILFANKDIVASDKNSSIDRNKTVEKNASVALKQEDKNRAKKYLEKLEELKKSKELDNEWTKTYSAYITHKKLVDKKKSIEAKIKKLKSLRTLTKKQIRQLEELEKEDKVLENKLSLVKNYEKEPFRQLITPPDLGEIPKISNPFAVIGGLSYIKELKNKKDSYLSKYDSLNNTIYNLRQEKMLLKNIFDITKTPLYKEKIEAINNEINELLTIKDIFKTTKEIFVKKADEVNLSLENDIKKEMEKAIYIAVVVFVFIVIFFGLKLLTRKYFSNKESYYTINKVINIVFITIMLITLLFAYLENVSYLITILGFASAGIAIAMKDWFMSLMGWFVILLGGSVHVGDRVKFVKDGMEYVGDVVDISMLRMTIHEDVTLTTYMHNRRAGRIIFVPNNYIFTDMIANYSHSGLKTVWDGIDFFITFDSNITKATNIAKNITKQYSKGYTDITRKQLNRLRSKYQLKNTNVEPRIFSFIEGYGMKISVWYLTNAYATLTLRSTISAKIIEEIKKEEDIKLAYPTQSIYHEQGIPKPIEAIDEVKDV